MQKTDAKAEGVQKTGLSKSKANDKGNLIRKKSFTTVDPTNPNLTMPTLPATFNQSQNL